MKNRNMLEMKGLFEFLTVAFMASVVALGVHFSQNIYQTLETTDVALAADEQIHSPKTMEEYESLVRERQRLESENSDLRANQARFEGEKNVILSQVRSSVKAFDDYRSQMGRDVKQLSDKIEGLQSENVQLRKAAERVTTYGTEAEGELERLNAQLREEVHVYRETVALLQQELMEKEDSRILKEAGKLHYNVGNFYFRNKQYDNAIKQYQKALLYQPQDADIHYNLAVVADEFLGNRKLALDHYKRFLSLRPNGRAANEVEERVLDLELYETVLAADKDVDANSPVRWLDQSMKQSETNHMYRG